LQDATEECNRQRKQGQGGDSGGPLPFALGQLLELLQQRLAAVPEPGNGASRIPAWAG
jgi:hypothetical protein